MSHPLADPCQQGEQNPRKSSMRFLRCRKTWEKPQYASLVLNGKCRLSEYAKVEPLIIGIQPCRRAGSPVALVHLGARYPSRSENPVADNDVRRGYG